MKTIRILASTLALSCAATSAFAGPGIQYWQRKTTEEKAPDTTAAAETTNKASEKADAKSAKAKPVALRKSAKAD